MLCCVTAYVFVKLSRNQSWVNLLFSVLRDSIRDLIPNSLFLILDSRFAQEWRIANQVENRDSQRTVNLLLKGTVCRFNHIYPVKFDMIAFHGCCGETTGILDSGVLRAEFLP